MKRSSCHGDQNTALVKWILEFLGIPGNFFLGSPRNKGVNFMVNSDWEFLGIPNHNNSGSKNLEIPSL